MRLAPALGLLEEGTSSHEDLKELHKLIVERREPGETRSWVEAGAV